MNAVEPKEKWEENCFQQNHYALKIKESRSTAQHPCDKHISHLHRSETQHPASTAGSRLLQCLNTITCLFLRHLLFCAQEGKEKK